jgi:hypothetical protein
MTTATTIRRMTAEDYTFSRTIKGKGGRCVPAFTLVPAGTIVDCTEGSFGLAAHVEVEGLRYYANQIQGLRLYGRPY